MATNIFTFYSDSLKGSFDSAYVGKCLQAASKELLTLTDSISEYHYTLYYYDQAGNLVKTVPPAGVVRSYRQSWLDSVKAARASGTLLAPSHTLITNYRYNTLNTMIAQMTPDAGHTSFWYDRLGRLVLSQNAKQLSEGGNYSYTLYDPLSRITEVGQINSGVGTVTTGTTKVPASWETWLGNNATNRYQVTNTVYDLPAAGIDLLLAQNPSTLRNRVSYSSVTPGQKGSGPVYSTYYNYDIEGNVSSLLQDYGATSPMGTNDQQYKQIDYGYDLVSGKVNSVSYQPGKTDAFMHFYQYDAENRLTDVYTTADSVTVEHEAHYEYYKHGPLARALIGQNQVQGLDYTYTLQGWLKAVNGSVLDSVNDMGRDGDPTVQSRKYIAKDAYGFSLHYFEGDYQPINGTTFLTDLKTKLGASYRGLYNGNISSMAVNIGILNNPKLYNYRYDQLNRLTGMDMLNGTNTGLNLWTNNLAASNDYTEKASYDPNGNILTYIRHGYGATPAMDSMTYHYQDTTNKLSYITDGVPSGNYPNDLDNQSAANYAYDAAGNLIRDSAAGITTDMTWSVYGKLLTIPSKSVSYQYDAAGNRIGKAVGSTNTWYVRDAQGNILTTYSGGEMVMQERDLYGSSRLGTITNPAAVPDTSVYLDHLGSGTLFTFTRGQKLFELTNHLGNVLATVSDKKFGTAVTGIPSQIAYYTADVKSAQDYYPFGMEMPGRQYNATTYTYSFNGKRDDKDAEYGWQDYGMREYDRRRGQFISVDPITKKYPDLTPYQFASNRPVDGTDLDGKEWELRTVKDNLLTEVRAHADDIIARAGTIRAWDGQPNVWGKINNAISNYSGPNPVSGTAARILYNIIDDAHITYTGWQRGPGYATHLDNTSVSSYNERINAGMNTVTLAFGGVQSAGERALLTTGIAFNGALGEAIFGNNLNKISKNFPVFDNLENGIATSAKSLDLNSPSYLKRPRSITSTLNKYTDKVAGFTSASRNRFTLSSSMIQTRELGVLTFGNPNAAQLQALGVASQYAEFRGVQFTLRSDGDQLGSTFNRALIATPKSINNSQDK